MGILGSHNTFTYRRPKQWYLRPLAFIARCQNLTYQHQYEKGARCFDVRIWFDEKGNIEFRHGIFRYDASDFYDIMQFCNEHELYVRIILEDRKYLDKECCARLLEVEFVELCYKLRRGYPNIKFWCGRNLFTWDILYDFKLQITDAGIYSSVTSMFDSDSKFLRSIDDIWPKYYAKNKNKENIKLLSDYNDTTVVSFDFIGLHTDVQ